MSDKTNIENTPTTVKEMLSLSGFLEENHNLVTVLGVFTALTVFAGSIPLPSFRNILSFFFMSLAILVWIELWRKFPKGNYTWRLYWFRNILTFSIISLVSYWFIGYSEMWKGYLLMALSSISLAVFGFLNRKFHVYERLYDAQFIEFKLIRKITWIALLAAWFGGSIYFAYRISPSIARTLNELHQTMLASKP